MCCAGDQLGRLGEHYVLHPRRALVLGLDVLRLSHHSKFCNVQALSTPCAVIHATEDSSL